MRIISESEYLKEVEPILRKLFTKDDPFGRFFAEDIEEKKIIWGHYADFSPPLSDGVIQEALSMGDREFYYTSIWVESVEPKEPICHCCISFDEFNLPGEQSNQEEWDAIQDFHLLEYVIYSPTGQWGIMFSHEHHALVAGNRELIESIANSIPDFTFNEQIHDFLDYWRDYNSNGYQTSWILSLLIQICGEAEARRLLKEYDMQPALY